MGLGDYVKGESLGLKGLKIIEENVAKRLAPIQLLQMYTCQMGNIYENMGRWNDALQYDKKVIEMFQSGLPAQVDAIDTMKRVGMYELEHGTFVCHACIYMYVLMLCILIFLPPLPSLTHTNKIKIGDSAFAEDQITQCLNIYRMTLLNGINLCK